MEIRKVNANDDFEAIGNIYSCSWKAAYDGIVPKNYLNELSGDNWSSVLAKNKYDSYVIMDGEKYVGTSSICAARDKKMAGCGEIASIQHGFWCNGDSTTITIGGKELKEVRYIK